MTNSNRNGSKRHEDDLEAFMAIARAVAVEESRSMPTTPELLQHAGAIVEAARDRLAAMRRDELARHPSNVVASEIRGWIRAMAEPELIAYLTTARVEHPDLQFAFRGYETMSLEDLRSAVEDVVSLQQREN
jgi:hypothetical protein